jgi:hypothetical protein
LTSSSRIADPVSRISNRRFVRRLYETTFLVAARQARTIVAFWARQCRKTTNLGALAFYEMSSAPERHVIAASASLLVGTELVSKTLGATEQAAVVAREAAALNSVLAKSAAGKFDLKVARSDTEKIYAGLTPENFSDLYRSGRLEFRLYFDQTAYSRLRVIAPNPATARGWTGFVIRDEAGFTPVNLETELQIAVGPIIDSDPTFKMVYASNLPRDDRHPFFEMTMPPPDLKFQANPAGNFYRGLNGVLVHRVSLADAYAAGHTLYDSNTGEPLTLEQFRSKPGNKIQLPWNYDLIHESGGAAAIDFVALQTAQRRGANQCVFAWIETDKDLHRAISQMVVNLRDGRIGGGFDVATTTDETSNPSSLTVTEQLGIERFARGVFVWKTKKPQIARHWMKLVIDAVKERKNGGAMRRLCIDASNERYFAEETADELGGYVPVELVIAKVAVQPPGYTEPTNFKTWLGDMYCAAVNENHYALPSAEYIKIDHRLPVKDRGTYDCVPNMAGMHGDTFDSGKLAEYALAAPGAALGASVPMTSSERAGRSRMSRNLGGMI